MQKTKKKSDYVCKLKILLFNFWSKTCTQTNTHTPHYPALCVFQRTAVMCEPRWGQVVSVSAPAPEEKKNQEKRWNSLNMPVLWYPVLFIHDPNTDKKGNDMLEPPSHPGRMVFSKPSTLWNVLMTCMWINSYIIQVVCTFRMYSQQIIDWTFKTDQRMSTIHRPLHRRALGSCREMHWEVTGSALPLPPNHPLYSAGYIPPPSPGEKRLWKKRRRTSTMCVPSPLWLLLIISND